MGHLRQDVVGALVVVALVSAAGPEAVRANDAGAAAESSTTASAPAAIEMTPDAALARLSEKGRDGPTPEELSPMEAALRQALLSEPKNAKWHYGLGLVERVKMGREADAAARVVLAEASLKHINEATKLDPKNPDYLFMLGQATMSTIKPGDGFMTMADIAGDAKEAWEKAIKLDDDHIPSRMAMVQYEIRARKQGGMLFGSYKAARRHAEKILNAPGGKHLGHMALGNVAAAEEEWEEMSKQYALSFEHAADDAERRNALFSHASSLIDGKKDAKAAMPLVEKLVALNTSPGDYMHMFLRAKAHKMMGDCAGAIPDFKEVLVRSPQAQMTRLLLAECYESTGDKAAALSAYEDFKAKFPTHDRIAEVNKAIKRLGGKG